MATLYDGVAVFAAADGAVALAADQNTIQSKLILGLEERERNASLVSGEATSAGDWIYVYSLGGTPGMYWHEGTHTASSEVVFPLDLRVGEYITEAHAYVKGDAAMTGGRLDIRGNPITGAGVDIQIADIANGDADPWQNVAITHYSVTGINYTVLANYDYYIAVVNAAAGPVADTWLYGLMIKTWFHAGV